MPRPPDAGPTGPRFRTPQDLAGERGGAAPWCGPAAVALAAGVPYDAACDLIRRAAPERYPGGEIVTTWWRDLLAALREAGVSAAPAVAVADSPTLIRWARQLGEAGWYLVRVTDHFLLLHCDGDGAARVYDNRIGGAPLGVATHGRRRVSHVARLPEGPRG